MSNIKKFLAVLISAVCFNAFCVWYEQFMLPVSFRYSLIDHYNKKYTANIEDPILGNDCLNSFLGSRAFWYCFKMSDYYKKDDDVRLMWFAGIDGGHAVPVFYIQENGKRAIFIADSLGMQHYSVTIDPFGKQSYEFTSLTDSAMYHALRIPIFIIKDRRQSDQYSCYLDALVWGKIVTGKLSDGTYRIPNLLEFLFQYSERIPLDNSHAQLFYVKKLPTTLLATTQQAYFMEKYRVDGDDTYITSKGMHISFNQFLNNHKKVFAFDYLRSKGVFISYYFYKYLSFKDSIKYGLNIL